MEMKVLTSWMRESSIKKQVYEKNKAFLIQELKRLRPNILNMGYFKSNNLVKILYLLSNLLSSQNKLYKKFSEYNERFINQIENQIISNPFNSLEHYIPHTFQSFKKVHNQALEIQSMIKQQLILLNTLGIRKSIKASSIKLKLIDFNREFKNNKDIIKSVIIPNNGINKRHALKTGKQVLKLYNLELDKQKKLHQNLISTARIFNQKFLIKSKERIVDVKWLVHAIAYSASFFGIIQNPIFSYVINIANYTDGSNI